MTLADVLMHPAVQALGRALLHFIWEGALLALFLWIVKTTAPSSAARLRYAVASLIILMMPIALIVTATWNWNSRSKPGSAGPAPGSSMQEAPAPTPQQDVNNPPPSSTPHAGISAATNVMTFWPGWVVCIWMIGVLLLSARMAGGWMGLRKLKRGASPAGAELEDIVTRLKQRLRVSAPVRLCTSRAIRVPSAVGWLRPYILLPVTALTGLGEEQIAAILAHELAHIRRNDYLVNLIQTVIETMLFYHPAVWWVGRQMRLEREHCCDDMAVAVCGSAYKYASALAAMEQIRDWMPEPALKATGGELLGRIPRVLGRGDHASRSWGSLAPAVLLLVLVLYSGRSFARLAVDPTAEGEPGLKHETGQGVSRDDGQALSWYRKAAEAGDATAMSYLGLMYENGRGVPQDYAQALSWFRKGVDAGMTDLGAMYQFGRGVPKDDAQAASWFRKAAEAGNANGMASLGWMYMHGQGVSRDDGQALSWLQKAAASNANAMTNLGVMYENGRAVPQDYGQAMSRYRKAAEAGDAEGMTSLGFMYMNGRGVLQDDAQAMSWYRKAVEAGNARAMTNLGFMYETGRSVPQDHAQAMSWYRKADALSAPNGVPGPPSNR